MSIPDLSDRTLFPPFLELPQEEEVESDARPSGDVYLIAQVKDNMTITKPTLVLTDRDGHPFAIVFEGYGRDELDLAKMGLRKGATAIVRGARRVVSSGPEGSADPKDRRPIVRIARGEAHRVRAVPASLDKVVALATHLRRQQQQQASEATTAGHGHNNRHCHACGKASDKASGSATEETPAPTKLLKCTGCGQTWYCNRTCQTKGWADGHKGECKALRGVCSIWG